MIWHEQADDRCALMPGVRTVKVGGAVLTYGALVQLVGGQAARLCPVEFDVARDMGSPEATQLYAWLKRRGLEPEITGARAVATARHGRSLVRKRADPDE